MRIEIHNHRRGQEVFMRSGRTYDVFAGMLVGTAQSTEDHFAVAAHWHKFLREHGWKERKRPLLTNGFVDDHFLGRGRACVSLSLVHGHQVGHVLLAMQGLRARDEIDVGVLCVEGKDTLAGIKTDLAWLRQVVTVPLLLVAVNGAQK